MKFTYQAIKHRFLKLIYQDELSLMQREHTAEMKQDKVNKIFENQIVDNAISKFKNNKGIFNGFALTESSIRCLCYHLLKRSQNDFSILEFGGGQSTLFWNTLAQSVNLKVTTIEHNPYYSKLLTEQTNPDFIRILLRPLNQLDDDIFKKLFKLSSDPYSDWENYSYLVAENDLKNTKLKNAFYNISSADLITARFDAMVLDGPHGNGRSIAFQLCQNLIKTNQLILIDDFDHYPFLDDLSKLFNYEIIEMRHYIQSNKAWVLLRIIDAN